MLEGGHVVTLTVVATIRTCCLLTQIWEAYIFILISYGIVHNMWQQNVNSITIVTQKCQKTNDLANKIG